MSDHPYRWVQWNPFKRAYDACILAGVGLYLGVFMAVGLSLQPDTAGISPEILVIRALGTCAFLMLTIILCIGPLARLSERFKPLLYNRRHLGVATAVIGVAHGGLATLWYHGFGVVNPLLSLFVTNPRYDSLSGFPFEVLGFAALASLILLAATSHDFWLRQLGPSFWKALHMSVYSAYALLVAHIALGALQSEPAAIYAPILIFSVVLVSGLHLVAGLVSLRRTKAGATWRLIEIEDPWGIPDGRGRGLETGTGETVAVFRMGDQLFAMSNVCAHQAGPLCEGRVVDGLVTCPWHGYQYRPDDGCSPPPFSEQVPTYSLALHGRHVLMDPRPNPPGAVAPPLTLPKDSA